MNSYYYPESHQTVPLDPSMFLINDRKLINEDTFCGVAPLMMFSKPVLPQKFTIEQSGFEDSMQPQFHLKVDTFQEFSVPIDN